MQGVAVRDEAGAEEVFGGTGLEGGEALEVGEDGAELGLVDC